MVIKQITREYKCVKEHLFMYFAMVNQLLENFEVVSIRHVPRIENQVANDLAQIASGYKVSTGKLKDFVEVKDKVSPTKTPSPNLSIQKAGGRGFGSNF